MNPTPANLTKRRRDGATMPITRERIDEETGQIITVQIDTTKSAKRRHQKTGGAQWKPTKGEINAADIWNKQEEKIVRDREREERKKKLAVRQAEKDAKAKEAQEELLRRGKISIEDTWAKVSASQNRLTGFFCAPKTSKPTTSIKSLENIEAEVEQVHKDRTTDSFQGEANTTDCNLSNTTTNVSPKQRSLHQSSNGQHEPHIPSSKSNTLMLPPPQPIIHASKRAVLEAKPLQVTFASSSSSQPTSEAAAQCLSQMTSSQVNIKMNSISTRTVSAKQNNSEKAGLLPPSTQVLTDTLAGLSSQDFVDDLNLDFSQVDKDSSSIHIAKCCSNHETALNGCQTNNIQYIEDDINMDDFDDEGIDDETLLYFAATQRLRKDPATTSDHTVSTALLFNKLSSQDVDASVIKSTSLPITSSKTMSAGDSFAFTDVDDDDLLRCVEDFENDTDDLDDEDLLQFMEEFEAGNGLCEHDRRVKKRRVLPWVKNPVHFSSQESVLTSCTATQSFDDF